MNTRQAKQAAQHWVEHNRERWPGLRAAHLVGGITTMADDAPFPANKDVDLHLIFADGDPALNGGNPWLSLIEDSFDSVMIEAGLKPITLYESADAVLANPEIAHHLTVDSILYDPDGRLRDLQPAVRRDYRQRRWVRARLEHERRGMAEALGLLAAARSMWGASSEVNILGYTMTFATAALYVASLQSPRMGSHTLLRLREKLAEHDRLDLYEAFLAALGLARADPAFAGQSLREATEGFDDAIALRQRSEAAAADVGPFRHKLQAHLRPYFVDSCRSMLDGGHHQEALGWIVPYHLTTADVMIAHGSAAEKADYAARQQRFLQSLGLDTAEARDSAADRISQIHEEIFVLADSIVAAHPDVID